MTPSQEVLDIYPWCSKQKIPSKQLWMPYALTPIPSWVFLPNLPGISPLLQKHTIGPAKKKAKAKTHDLLILICSFAHDLTESKLICSWFTSCVVEPTPLKNMLVTLDHFPKFQGENSKNIWNHHLEKLRRALWNQTIYLKIPSKDPCGFHHVYTSLLNHVSCW